MVVAALSTLTFYAALLLTFRPDVIFDKAVKADVASGGGLVSRPAVLTVENTGDDDIWVYLPALKKVRRRHPARRQGAPLLPADETGHEERRHRPHGDCRIRELQDRHPRKRRPVPTACTRTQLLTCMLLVPLLTAILLAGTSAVDQPGCRRGTFQDGRAGR